MSSRQPVIHVTIFTKDGEDPLEGSWYTVSNESGAAAYILYVDEIHEVVVPADNVARVELVRAYPPATNG